MTTDMTFGLSESERIRIVTERRPTNGYISPSSLKEYLLCPMKFKLHYIDRIKQSKSVALVLGSGLHKCFERYWSEGTLSKSELDKTISQFTSDPSIEGYGKDPVKETQKMVEMFDLWQTKHAANPQGCYIPKPLSEPDPWVECYFDSELDAAWHIHGFLDLVGVNKQLYDYKSSGQMWNPNRANVEIQSFVYPVVVGQALGEPKPVPMAYVLFVKYSKVSDASFAMRYVSLGDEHFEYFWSELMPAALSDLKASLDGSRPWLAHPSEDNCAYCPYWKECKVHVSNE